MINIAAIRARNEADRARLGQHSYCQDLFYACPAHPEYMGNDTTRECDCDEPERRQRVADIDALLNVIDSVMEQTNILFWSKAPAVSQP